MDSSLRPYKTTRTTTTINNIIVVEDRLSKLPDELLLRILSFLPTRDAAATCVLCWNLKRVFSLITSLDFDVSPISHCLRRPYATECFPNFVTFVTSVLQSYRFHCLTKFTLRLRTENYFSKDCNADHLCVATCFPDMSLAQITTWISFPLTLRGLRELDLCIMVRDRGYAQLPPDIFSSETLQVLKLEVNLGIDLVSSMPSYHLPNLKLLHLSVSFISDYGFLPRLVSSCPLLEDLKFVTFTNQAHHMTIVSPSLRRLCLCIHKSLKIGEAYSDLVRIDSPNLEYFRYLDNVAWKYSIPTMHHLVEAEITLDNESDNSFQRVLCFIRSLSNVQHLYFTGTCLELLAYVGVKDQLPMFPNLNHLKLGDPQYYWDTLLWEFLNCSPVLETFVFEKGLPVFAFEGEALELAREFYSTTHETPLCCKSHLKRIVIKGYVGSERELELIQFLLRHALVLQELVVYRCQYQNPLLDRISAKNTLKNLPRASATCMIQLL